MNDPTRRRPAELELLASEFDDLRRRVCGDLPGLAAPPDGEAALVGWLELLDAHTETADRVSRAATVLGLEPLAAAMSRAADGFSAWMEEPATLSEAARTLIEDWSRQWLECLRDGDVDACRAACRLAGSPVWVAPADPRHVQRWADTLPGALATRFGMHAPASGATAPDAATAEPPARREADASEALEDADADLLEAPPLRVEPSLLALLRVEVPALAEALAADLRRVARGGAIDAAMRVAHTLKGTADSVGLARAAGLAHRIEDRLQRAAAHHGLSTEEIGAMHRLAQRLEQWACSWRTPVGKAVSDGGRDGDGPDRLDRDVVGSSAAGERGNSVGGGAAGAAGAAGSDLRSDPDALRPCATLVPGMQAVLSHAAQATGHSARLSISGAQAHASAATLAMLSGPLMHLLRNAVDHGIESPVDRARAGKLPVGTVRVVFARQGDALRVEVGDDGRGFDLEAIAARAGQPPVVDPQALLERLLEPGFSTRARADRLSGRGVGLDAVAHAVSEAGGRLELVHRAGSGARFVIEMPARLASTAARG